MSSSTLHGTVVSAVFVASVSLVTILQGQNFYPSQTLFSKCMTTMDWHQDSI